MQKTRKYYRTLYRSNGIGDPPLITSNTPHPMSLSLTHPTPCPPLSILSADHDSELGAFRLRSCMTGTAEVALWAEKGSYRHNRGSVAEGVQHKSPDLVVYLAWPLTSLDPVHAQPFLAAVARPRLVLQRRAMSIWRRTEAPPPDLMPSSSTSKALSRIVATMSSSKLAEIFDWNLSKPNKTCSNLLKHLVETR